MSGAYRVLGYVSHYVDWNHKEAEAHFRRAIDLGPDDSGALSWYGDFLLDMRRFDEARVQSRVRSTRNRAGWNR